ncbi:MAG: hypothetical protein NC110_08105 [Ruminococcus sp.]|nr:hypothetical protein [Ruminococcus sp.]
MYRNTITVFNYHALTETWYPTVIHNTDLLGVKSSNSTNHGKTNGDTVEILINCDSCKKIQTQFGLKKYIGPKAYAKCQYPDDYVTFKPECDFIFDGVWEDTATYDENDYESGLYHHMNNEHDGIYMITSAAYFGLIPHFEIGGR